MNYTLFDDAGVIIRSGVCPPGDFERQARPGQFVLEGKGNDAKYKVEFDGLDESGRPVSPRLVEKTESEKAQSRIPTPSEAELPIVLKKKDYDILMKRIENLELKSEKENGGRVDA
ncbi:MAG: hypothetical protein JXM79_11075 [Sedimentisphaerales bacterium]|nr:hypothetical protein [Sedimentisphaerales bacterium]